MKRAFLLTIILANLYGNGFAQIVDGPPGYVDSLKYQSAMAKDDTSRVLALAHLSWTYAFIDFDSSAIYSQQALKLAQHVKFHKGEVRSLYGLGNAFQTKGEMPKALDLFFKALQMAERNHYQLEKAMCLTHIGTVFLDLNDNPKAISYFNKANKITATIKNEKEAENVKNLTDINLGQALAQNKQLDSASICLENLYKRTLHNKYWHPAVLIFFGDLQFRLGKKQVALDYLHESLEIFQSRKGHLSTAGACLYLAGFFKEMNQPDSCIYYARKGLAEAQIIKLTTLTLLISKLLAEQYEKRDINQAHHYLKIAMAANDELYGAKNVQDLQKIVFDEQEREQQVEFNRIAYENRMKQYAFAAGLSIVLLIAFFLYRNNRQKQKANAVLENTLSKLKQTQTQLIQSEKLASLGELTAGIAHEIQNPLNFVNNFSEVSSELVSEMKEELAVGNQQSANEIADDLQQNLEKITLHGKRASSIVKGMLEHSKASSGEKEPTDINALADEYLRLSYHGLRAKDKDFNSDFKTDFDPYLPKAKIIPQDMGRVLLNLINNAFYAVKEVDNPLVSVSTKLTDKQIIIKVKDNGSGMSQEVKAKIFQPFFTTKPTGQGTGLGLSLAYDIVTKGHGGTIECESVEGEGTTFIVKLSIV